VLVADTNFFKVFSYELVTGSSAHVSYNDVFLSTAMAAKYFGALDPVGKTMKVFRNSYTVKGVFKGLPANTHLKFEYFAFLTSGIERLECGLHVHVCSIEGRP